jgi:hypothetical protein
MGETSRTLSQELPEVHRGGAGIALIASPIVTSKRLLSKWFGFYDASNARIKTAWMRRRSAKSVV